MKRKNTTLPVSILNELGESRPGNRRFTRNNKKPRHNRRTKVDLSDEEFAGFDSDQDQKPSQRPPKAAEDDDVRYYADKLGIKNASELPPEFEDDGLAFLTEGLDVPEDSESDSQGENDNDDDHADSNEDSDIESGSDSDDSNIYIPANENPYRPPTAGTYIPPSMRQKSDPNVQLTRQIKGILNKLSESNIWTIATNLNNLYMDNPRQTTTENISQLILDSVKQSAVVNDSFVLLYAGLVSCLYRLQGLEFAAHFVQTAVESFLSQHAIADSRAAGNSLLVIAALYSLHVVSSTLIYDITRMLVSDINELNTELLLKLLRVTDAQLRKDDPSSLKDIVLLFQQNSPADLSGRAAFLADALVSLKNNKSKLRSDSTAAQILKLTKLVNQGPGNATQPINVSLSDIKNIDVNGKWWLVGAAWKNNTNGSENVSLSTTSTSTAARSSSSSRLKLSKDDGLIATEVNWDDLSKQNGMNTSVRKSIFVALMGSTDCANAFERIDKLHLTKSQSYEVPRVILHCAAKEPTFNLFYALVAGRFCQKHSYKKAFEFSFWDIWKALESGEGEEGLIGPDDKSRLQRLINLSKLYGVLTAKGYLTLSIVRNVNFVGLNKPSQIFLELYLQESLLRSAKKQSPEKAAKALFEPIASNTTVLLGLRYSLAKLQESEIIPLEQRPLLKSLVESAEVFYSNIDN
ncbi:hypothetical protein CANCADRAFT_75480 [Tortispora caseinolytica NRRL Y-17796]|uniref:MI domain-containing protein n=1 Tax=Tortispora caseinolytica NRRL Y-17796 TaxID=767744 RepID=A0A1E4TJ03_9ASCO|nr:hypothetical protein CANCADRAFT_75480 [Tortispora caseinolytica NRRL Y-17796]